MSGINEPGKWIQAGVEYKQNNYTLPYDEYKTETPYENKTYCMYMYVKCYIQIQCIVISQSYGFLNFPIIIITFHPQIFIQLWEYVFCKVASGITTNNRQQNKLLLI